VTKLRFFRAPLAAAALLVAALAPAAALAQLSPHYSREARPLPPAQRQERYFLQQASAHVRLQAEASQLALARTNNPAVKELAKLVLARHRTAQPEVLRMLQSRGMAMPLSTNEANKLLKQLAKLKGAQFDRMYVEDAVLRTSQLDVANYEKVATQAEDSVLKGWVERQLPMLRTQVEKASRALPAAALRGQRAV
jgi:putative membrane protein